MNVGGQLSLLLASFSGQELNHMLVGFAHKQLPGNEAFTSFPSLMNFGTFKTRSLSRQTIEICREKQEEKRI